MSSVTVCNRPQNTPDPAWLRAVSSRPSDQQQKKPDGRTCWAGSVHGTETWRLLTNYNNYSFQQSSGLVYPVLQRMLHWSMIDVHQLCRLGPKLDDDLLHQTSPTRGRIRWWTGLKSLWRTAANCRIMHLLIALQTAESVTYNSSPVTLPASYQHQLHCSLTTFNQSVSTTCSLQIILISFLFKICSNTSVIRISNAQQYDITMTHSS